ncbi:hypothetical protein OS493_016112 [Desmophyllum pertusum]|uniref:Nicotinate-nucleotide pyrophosphorylase [carboxylating] n=1 Tax=Desmophyllum pertusum TaxID=174260 RepID=A0A9X0A2L0_9CNID|nr:hypothetical protein OS493_016112 [Desmophyllum pertusum]
MADKKLQFLLHPVSLRQHVQQWLAEDTPSFDYGGFVVGENEETAVLLCKSKDNHIWTAGSVKQAVQDARKVGGFSIKIEVECRSVEEAREAATAGADVVMLDNFDPETLHEAAEVLKQEFPHLLIEGSGGVKMENIAHYFGPHVDVISMGSLTQGYEAVNFSLKILKDGHNPHNPVVKTC